MSMQANRVVVVTGAGRGIGKAIALQLAAERWRVLVVDNGCRVDGVGSDESIAGQTVADITVSGGTALGAPIDVRRKGEVDEAIETVISRWGSLDAVVNAAGVIRLNDVLSATDDDWQTLYDVHVRGAYHLAQRAIAHWHSRSAPFGRVVNFTSAAGIEGIPHMLVYSTVKAAVIGLTQALAASVPAGITVNAVYPIGWTRMAVRGTGADAISARREAGAWPLNPAIDPAYVAPLVSFLLSDKAAHINGRLVGNVGRRYTALGDRPEIHSITSESVNAQSMATDIANGFADLGSASNRWQVDLLDTNPTRYDFPVDELD